MIATLIRHVPVLRRLLKCPIILAQSGVASSVTGTTAETTLASFIVPGGLVGPNGELAIKTIWNFTNNANAKSLKFYLGGVLLLNQSAPSAAGYQVVFTLSNAGGQGSQVLWATGTTGSGNAPPSFSVNTAADQLFEIKVLLGVATDTATLQRLRAEITPS